VELLSDIVRRPKFDPEELERERKVVLEEIRMVEDTPEELIYDLFSTHFFPRHSLGRPIQGTLETVGSLGRRRLLRFFRGAYRPGNMLIVAAGNLHHGKLCRLVKEAFGTMKPGASAVTKVTRPRVRGGIFSRSKKLEQMHLLLGMAAHPGKFSQRYPLFVLNALLGGTMSSRLFQKIREERGLAYNVYSGVNAFMDSGFLMVYAATGPSKGGEAVRLVLEELRDLKNNGPQEAEVDVAKEHLKGSLMLSLESTSSRMSNLARQELYFGKQFTLKQILAGIDRVTPRTVHGVARDLLGYERIGLAALGRIGRLRLGEEALSL
jgi:predicted Zn-dependent peptidase